MRCVTTKPPRMFTADTAVATAPRPLAIGSCAPAKRCMPPITVMPEIALVTDMRGVCRAWATPQTAWYPAAPARRKDLMTVTGAPSPMSSTSSMSNEITVARTRASRRGLSSFLALSLAAGALAAAGLPTGGGGGIFSSRPSAQVTMLRATMSPASPSSSCWYRLRTRPGAFSLPCTCRRSCIMFCAYMELDCAAMRAGRSV
mmetsp:Transcript_54734/g.155709  ORF Transcript_54734/g.155709 Transcript_54734/m.155709 type:complete len:202 (-) Transcript_54734:1117-1722(-)